MMTEYRGLHLSRLRVTSQLRRSNEPEGSRVCFSEQLTANVSLYLLHSLDHRLQPVGVDLTVAVQEGQDGGGGRVGSAHT